MKVSVYEAKSKLSQMINKALEGEEVVITRNGEVTVKLVPVPGGDLKSSWLGSWQGKAKIHDGFYEPLQNEETVEFLTGELAS